MESQFDPRLLLLPDGKGSKLFKASILPAADVSCAFLLCAKQRTLLRCFYSSVVFLIALQDKQTSFPRGQISTSMLRQETWEFIPVGSSHMHTHAHMSLGTACVSRTVNWRGGERGQSAQDCLGWLHIIKERYSKNQQWLVSSIKWPWDPKCILDNVLNWNTDHLLAYFNHRSRKVRNKSGTKNSVNHR